MMSWKCGRNTAAFFCEETDCDTDMSYGESAGGGSESQDAGNASSLTLLTLKTYDPAVKKAITVFSMTECHGHSAVLWSDEVYDDTKNQLALGTEIRSVMMPEDGVDNWQVDFYSTTDFNYWSGVLGTLDTVRHTVGRDDKLDDRNDC